MTDEQMEALRNFRLAYEFYQACKRDMTSVETGAWADAVDWLRKAETELYAATHGMAV